MALDPSDVQYPKEWKRFAQALGRTLPTKLVQTRRTSKRIRALFASGRRK